MLPVGEPPCLVYTQSVSPSDRAECHGSTHLIWDNHSSQGFELVVDESQHTSLYLLPYLPSLAYCSIPMFGMLPYSEHQSLLLFPASLRYLGVLRAMTA